MTYMDWSKAVSLVAILLVTFIFQLDAFLTEPLGPHHSSPKIWGPKTLVSTTPTTTKATTRTSSALKLSRASSNNKSAEGNTSVSNALTHRDILWKLRPPPDMPRWKRWWLKFAANLIRLDCKLKRQEPPLVLCPKGGQAVLEAYYRPDGSSSKFEKIARFGFTTLRGPANEPIQETVKDIYGIQQGMLVGAAAIIYMFVEPEYRKRNVGKLALEVISLIHAIQGADFTMLVVDDDGSGKLNAWYEKNGYTNAPKLQQLLGSPDGIHGLSMIAPTNRELPKDCFIQWW